MSSPNEMKCPECGELICFTVLAAVPLRLTEGEPKILPEKPYWDESSSCWCESCGFESTVETFTDAYEKDQKDATEKAKS